MLAKEELYKQYIVFVDDFSDEENLSATTRKNKKNGLKRFLDFLGEEPLSEDSIRAYIRHLKNTPVRGEPRSEKSIKTELAHIKAFVHFLVDRRVIPIDYIINLPKVKQHRILKRYPKETIALEAIKQGTIPSKSDNRYAKASKIKVAVFLTILLKSGLRINDARKIKGQDVNLLADEPHILITPKGGNQYLQPIPLDSLDVFRTENPHDLLFDVSEHSCRVALKRGCAALGIEPIVPHDLRKIFTLGRLNRDHSLQKVSKTLNHTSVTITDKYYSPYMIEDLATVVNDSPIINIKRPPNYWWDKVAKAIEETNINNGLNSRLQSMERIDCGDEEEFVIKLRVKKI